MTTNRHQGAEELAAKVVFVAVGIVLVCAIAVAVLKVLA